MPGIFEAMSHAERDVGRLVLAEQELLFATGDERCPAHDDPMFRAVVMHLQRQARTGTHNDAFDLKALAVIDRIVKAPWPTDFSMRIGLRRLVPLDA